MKRFIEVLFTSFRRLEMDPLYMGWDLSRFWRGLGRRLWELRRLWRWLLTLMKELIRIKEDNFFSDGRVGLRGRSLSIACGVGGCVRGEGGGGREVLEDFGCVLMKFTRLPLLWLCSIVMIPSLAVSSM